ncbi:MAG: T9SS type A sorting domain-containing protein [Saprospiraceae bacterium]|nr:T9SS type A sorting domain-containing protein [Saprospiraceae bacterium]
MKINFAIRLCFFGAAFLLLTAERCVEITEINTPNFVAPGTPFQVKTRLKHLADDNNEFNLTYYLSYDRMWNPEDIPIGSKTLANFPINSARQVDQTLLVPANTFSGKYYLIAKALDGEMYRPIQVNGPVNMGADLVPAELMSYGGTQAGETFSFAFTLFNRGMLSAEHCVVRAYLSSDATVDATDRLMYTVPISSPMGANSLREFVGLQFALPGDLPKRDYYFILQADANNAVSESSETNNQVSKLQNLGTEQAMAEAEDRAAGIDPEPAAATLALSPNPTFDFLHVAYRLETASPVQLEVVDASGKTVFSSSERMLDAGEYTQQIELSRWPGGLYLLRMRCAGQEMVRKIVKQ